MEPQLHALLHEIENYGRENDARQSERSKKMLNLDPATAQLVSVLIRASNAKRVLEIGTSNGYSTIWLAWSVRHAGGRVITVERNPDKQALARENLTRGGLIDLVEMRLGDATQLVAELAASDSVGPFDAVFLDADRTKFPAQLAALLPKLSRKALVLADNALSHPEAIAAYLQSMNASSEFEHFVVPVGKGLSIAYRD